MQNGGHFVQGNMGELDDFLYCLLYMTKQGNIRNLVPEAGISGRDT